MTVRGMDVANYQSDMDVEAVVRDNGFDFVIVLANDGTYKNPFFGGQVAAAQHAGALVAAYVYQRPDWQATLAATMAVVPRSIPVIVDVEAGSGDIATTWALHRGLLANGYRTPYMYFPRWYWQQIGSPDLRGLPSLWKSWYPDYVRRDWDSGFAQLPSYVWDPYGGLPVSMVQFTSSGAIRDYPNNVDLDAHPGTREQLARTFYPTQEIPEDDDMPIQVETLPYGAGDHKVTFSAKCGESSILVKDLYVSLTSGFGSLSNVEIIFPLAAGGYGGSENKAPMTVPKFAQDASWWWKVPSGASAVSLVYTCDSDDSRPSLSFEATRK